MGHPNPSHCSDDAGNDVTLVITSQLTLTIVKKIQSAIKNPNAKIVEILVFVCLCSDQMNHFEAVIKELTKKFGNLQ